MTTENSTNSGMCRIWNGIRKEGSVDPLQIGEVENNSSKKVYEGRGGPYTQDLSLEEMNKAMRSNVYGSCTLDSGEKIPKFLSKYEILRLINTGSSGQVYLAYNSLIDKQVALKVLKPELSSNPQFLRNFLREARMASKVDHPNIVRIYDADQSENRYFIVMEYLNGGDLELEMKQSGGKLLPQRALYIVTCMAKALVSSHQSNIVHRDIKPANILLTNDRCPKLADLGIARQTIAPNESQGKEPHKMTTGILAGTPGFMAPEQRITQNVDIRADIYGLGGSFFNMLTGKRPHTNDSESNILQELRSWQRNLHSSLEGSNFENTKDGTTKRLINNLVEIVLKMMQPDPENRYQTPEDLLHALKNANSHFFPATIKRNSRRIVGVAMVFMTFLALPMGVLMRQDSVKKTVRILPEDHKKGLPEFQAAIVEVPLDPWGTLPKMLRINQPNSLENWPENLAKFNVEYLIAALVELKQFLPLERIHFDTLSEELTISGKPLSQDVLEKSRPGSVLPASILITLPAPLAVGEMFELHARCTDVGSTRIFYVTKISFDTSTPLADLYPALAAAIVIGLRDNFPARGRISLVRKNLIEIDLGLMDGLLSGDRVLIYPKIKNPRPSAVPSPLVSGRVSGHVEDFYAKIELENADLKLEVGMLVEKPAKNRSPGGG